MVSKMAQFFQTLAVDAEALQRFQHSTERREALLVETGFDAAERAMIQAADSQALHTRMLADHGMAYAFSAHNNNNSNNNSNQNISRFKRPPTSAR